MNDKEKKVGVAVIIGRLYIMGAPDYVLLALRRWSDEDLKARDGAPSEAIGVADACAVELVGGEH